VIKLVGGRIETVVDGLQKPEGITIIGNCLCVVDTGSKSLVSCTLSGGDRNVLATNLPVGAPIGITPHYLGPIGDMAGPMINFCGLTAGLDGTLYLSGDAEGSVLALRPTA